jgi:GNAT superfamily N-acetyltransferase
MPVVLEPSWVGRRVSVRRVLGREADGRLRTGDVVGDLVGLDAQTAVIESRTGLVEVPVALVAAARVAEPSTADELALEAIVAESWRPAEREALGGWVLRANSGFTRRANSVLPLRAPGLPLDEAIGRAHEWYAGRGLPLVVHVPLEARRLLDAELGERGWPADGHTRLLTARLDRLGTSDAADVSVRIAPAPDEPWLAVYRGGAAADPAARALLTRHVTVAFASVAVDGDTVAVARGTVDEGWLGITGLEVRPEHRRQGLGSALGAALWQWGRDHGATRCFVSVLVENEPALQLYERAGFRPHHEYHYRHFPTP